MSFEMTLWRVAGTRLEKLDPSTLDQEGRLEEWLERDPSVLGMEVAIVGRQVQTPFGGRIDLLAVDRNANCVILELKTPLNGSIVRGTQGQSHGNDCTGTR